MNANDGVESGYIPDRAKEKCDQLLVGSELAIRAIRRQLVGRQGAQTSKGLPPGRPASRYSCSRCRSAYAPPRQAVIRYRPRQEE